MFLLYAPIGGGSTWGRINEPLFAEHPITTPVELLGVVTVLVDCVNVSVYTSGDDLALWGAYHIGVVAVLIGRDRDGSKNADDCKHDHQFNDGETFGFHATPPE